MHGEAQYLDLMHRVWRDGVERGDRTGTGTRALFGETMRFDLSDGTVPILTTKRVFWKSAARELLWFLSGDRNIAPLVPQGVHIWTDWPLAHFNATQAAKRSIAMVSKRASSPMRISRRAGAISGRSMARNGGTGRATCRPATAVPPRRRWHRPDHRTGPWPEAQSFEPPPHLYRLERRRTRRHGTASVPHDLSVFHGRWHAFQASSTSARAIWGWALRFNIFEASLLLRMLAQQCDLEPGEMVWMGADCHLYANHEHLVTEQLARDPRPFPQLGDHAPARTTSSAIASRISRDRL